MQEAEMAVDYFKSHKPRHEADLRSLAGAMVARGNVAFSGFLLEERLPVLQEDLPRLAEKDYRAALLVSSSNTEYSSFAAISNLGNLAVRCWWHTGARVIAPSRVAHTLEKVCTLLTKRGIPFRSRTHARVRWILGLAIFESYGGLNRQAESRLQQVMEDLLKIGAIQDAAELAIDLGYCYLREGRWDEVETLNCAILHHPQIANIPEAWHKAFKQWQEHVSTQRAVEQALSRVCQTVRGVPYILEEIQDIHTPRHRHSDRTDTLGL